MREHERALRLRLLSMALDLKPRHIRAALGVSPAQLSGLLGGYRAVRPHERQKLARLVAQKTQAVFGPPEERG